ncbi:MAG: DNA-binding protein [Burkholderiales bacterium]
MYVQHSSECLQGALRAPGRPPLEAITSPTVDTAAAAFYLNRKPQTLRIWSAYQQGPIQPIRVHGRLAWRVSDIMRVLGIGAQQ